MKLFGILSISALCIIKANVALPTTTKVSTSEHPIVLVVSYDGFRYDYLSQVNTPTLDSLKANGVYVPHMQPVFPTMTFPNHQSIATGLYAESHGIVDNVFFDPQYNKTLSGFDDDPGFWNYNPDVLPLWFHNEFAGEGRVSGALMWPGSSQTYGSNDDSLPTYYFPGYNASVPWEERVETVISWITNDTKPANLVFLYYNEPDSKGHAYGPNSTETRQEVAKADERTDYLVKKLMEAEIFDKINLLLLSDHGMAGVSQRRIVNLTSVLDDNLISAKYGDTPVVQLVAKEGRLDELYESLSNHSNSPGFKVYKKEDLRDPFYYTASRRIQDLTVVADVGYGFDDFLDSIDYYNERYNLTADPDREYGVHGYGNQNEEMRPLFIAHGPAFRMGVDYPEIKNVDIVPLISRIIGIPEPANNGSFDRIKDILHPDMLKSGEKIQELLIT